MKFLKRIFSSSSTSKGQKIQGIAPERRMPETPQTRLLRVQRLENELAAAKAAILQAIAREYTQDNKSVTEIARRYRLTRSSVHRRLQAQGIHVSKKTNYTQEDVDHWVSLVQQGIPPKEICKRPEVNVNYDIIKDNLKKRGVRVRKEFFEIHDQLGKQIYDLRASGKKWREIAQIVKLSYHMTYYYAKKYAQAHDKPWPLTFRDPDQGKLIYDMRSAGKSWKECAAISHVTIGAAMQRARKHAKKNNLPWTPKPQDFPTPTPPLFPELAREPTLGDDST